MIRKCYVSIPGGAGPRANANQAVAVPDDHPGKKYPALVFDTQEELSAFQHGRGTTSSDTLATLEQHRDWSLSNSGSGWTITDAQGHKWEGSSIKETVDAATAPDGTGPGTTLPS